MVEEREGREGKTEEGDGRKWWEVEGREREGTGGGRKSSMEEEEGRGRKKGKQREREGSGGREGGEGKKEEGEGREGWEVAGSGGMVGEGRE